MSSKKNFVLLMVVLFCSDAAALAENAAPIIKSDCGYSAEVEKSRHELTLWMRGLEKRLNLCNSLQSVSCNANERLYCWCTLSNEGTLTDIRLRDAKPGDKERISHAFTLISPLPYPPNNLPCTDGISLILTRKHGIVEVKVKPNGFPKHRIGEQ